MKKGSYKTTKAEFARFKAEALRWIAFFGLLDYEVAFFHEHRDGRAQCFFDEEGRVASIILSREWIGRPEPLEVERAAFHEVAELLLFRLQMAGRQAMAVPAVCERAHEVIRRLENSVWKQRDVLLKPGSR